MQFLDYVPILFLEDRVFDRTMPCSVCCLNLIAMLARLVTAAARSFSWLSFCLRPAATSSDFFSFSLFLETTAATFWDAAAHSCLTDFSRPLLLF